MTANSAPVLIPVVHAFLKPFHLLVNYIPPLKNISTSTHEGGLKAKQPVMFYFGFCVNLFLLLFFMFYFYIWIFYIN